MPGKLEGLRKLLSSRFFRGTRDAAVKIVWHMDPELSVLHWTILDIIFSPGRQKQFFSWMQYDALYRRLKKELYANPEWRQGPQKSYDIAAGPLSALTFLADANISDCRVLDFGCGGHFSDSTGLILYLYGVQSVDCLEIGRTISGFENGAALDLAHWFQDKLISNNGLSFATGKLNLNPDRLDNLHRLAVKYEKSNKPVDKIPVYLIEGDLLSAEISDQFYDLITSNAVLEHVQDPPEIWTALKRVLKIGGLMHHQIDFRDHRFYTDPIQYPPLPSLNMLNWEDKDTNGWRFQDWLKLINQDDLEIISLIPETVDGVYLKLNENISIAACKVVVRRVK
jgi:SAM-dependent methyltransferase